MLPWLAMGAAFGYLIPSPESAEDWILGLVAFVAMAMTIISGWEYTRKVNRLVDGLLKRAHRAERALDFYADPESWRERGCDADPESGYCESTYREVDYDEGQRAREALDS